MNDGRSDTTRRAGAASVTLRPASSVTATSPPAGERPSRATATSSYARPHLREQLLDAPLGRVLREHARAQRRPVGLGLEDPRHVVRIVGSSKYQQTSPVGGSYTVTLGAGETISKRNFGEKKK